jgi:hypothetical protein
MRNKEKSVGSTNPKYKWPFGKILIIHCKGGILMAITFENFQVKRIIVHEIFKKEVDGSVSPDFNEGLLGISGEALSAFQERILEAVAHDSQCIQMDVVKVDIGSAYKFMEPFLDGGQSENAFIAMSKSLTEKLVSAQMSRTIPGGAVVVFESTISRNNNKCIGIIKAEKHSGFSMQTRDSKKILEFFNNLLLTPQQKLYKIGLLVDVKPNANIERTVDYAEMYVFDSNNIRAVGKAAANYFYDGFLGCAYQRSSDILTKTFYEHTKEFLTKKSKMPGEEIVDRMSALYTYLKVDNNQTISVDDFAQRYLPDAGAKDSYSAYMQSTNVPMISFSKDLTMLKGKLNRRKIKFTNDVYIYAPSETFNENVQFVEKTDADTTVRIKGHIKTETT